MRKGSKKYKEVINNSNVLNEALASYGDYVEDDYTIAKQAIQGVDANLFYDMVDITGLPKDILAEYLDISTKTLERYKAVSYTHLTLPTTPYV